MTRKFLLLLACLVLGIGLANAQPGRVTGVVTSSEDGEPVVGASVVEKGTMNGTFTDANGKFTLGNVADMNGTLVISVVGMKDEEVAIKPFVEVVMHPDNEFLDEVVVVAYGVAKKSAYTGAASEVKADKLENRQMSNVSSALVGTMAGVQTIQSNGQPGTSTTVRIRGISSINGVSSPLYVVDGVPYDGDLSAINSQDIASITVLKDAVSTSLYGSRGSNGVVMITTKRGERGDAKVTFDAKWGAVSRATKNYDVVSEPGQYYEMLYEAYYNAYYYNNGWTAARAHSEANSSIASATGYTIYTVPDGQYLIGSNGKLNPNATLGYSDGDYYYYPDDWEEETFKTTFRQEYNVGVSGATDQFNYYGSFSYLQDDGLIKSSGFERLTGRLNVEYKAKKWLTIGANMAYTKTKSYYPGSQTSTTSSANAFFLANTIAPIYPMYVRNLDGSIAYDSGTGKKIYDYGDGASTNFTRNYMSIANPVGDLTYDISTYDMNIFEGNWFAKFDFGYGFSATARLALHNDNTIYNGYGNNLYGQSSAYGGTAEQEQMRETALTHQYLLNYINSFGKHNVSITAGFEGYRLKFEYFYGYGYDLYKSGDYTLGNATSNYGIGGQTHKYNTAGFFFSGNYNYDETYYVNLGYRRDGTSAFAEENRWGDFYNFGLGWNMKKASFLSSFDALDILKLRASFGQTGNDNHNYSGYYGWYSYEDIYYMTGSDGSFADGTLLYKGNSDLEWEKTNSFDFGADFSFWRNRLSGNADFFYRATDNLLDFKNVAVSNGYSSIPVNMGSVHNYGIELEVNYDIISNKQIQWGVSLNATWLKNKIHKLSDDYEDGQYISGSRIYREGESIYNYYLVKYAGVDPDTGEALYYSVELDDESNPVTDDDGNYVEVINTDYDSAYSYNRKESGSILPKVYGGFGTTVNWKGFDLSVQTSWQLGGRIYDSGYATLMSTGGTSFDAGQNFHKDLLNAWSETNTSTDIPRMDINDSDATSTSDRFLTSSNYFSIDNITLGYTLPNKLTNKIGIENLRVYFAAENVWLFSARQGLDPRMSFTTGTTSSYTARRTLSGGIKFSF